MSSATDVQRGSSMISGANINESAEELERHADPTSNSNNLGGLEPECSKDEL